MAEELRWEQLYDSETGTGTTSDSAAVFTNESSTTMHIRSIDCAHSVLLSGQVGDTNKCEISKSPSQTNMNTNNDTFFRWVQECSTSSNSAAVAVAGMADVNGGKLFAKGQLTLEPNESLYMNWQKDADADVYFRYIIGYHY